MEAKRVLSEVLKEIKPSDKKLLKTVEKKLKDLNKLIKKNKVNAKAVLGGSIAKGTYLEKDHDCDVFVKFDYQKYKDKDISKELGKILEPLKPEMVHGSRDYYCLRDEIEYEIVPVLDIKDFRKAKNVTDMSPLHVEWVKKNRGHEDDIRLAKQFCKAARVYGAESYIKGFSGHVLDILVIHYGGFMELLKKATAWEDKEVIDPEGYYTKSKGNGMKEHSKKEIKQEVLEKLNKSKTNSPIIVVDPVDKERNAAAALSYEMCRRFQEKAEKFLKRPTKEHFKIKRVTKAQLKKKAGKDKLILLEAIPKEGKKDVAGAKLLKSMKQIRNQLKFYDFKVKEAGWYWNGKGKALFWYLLDPKDLFPITKWPGPPLKEKHRVKEFKKKHKKTFKQGGRICAYVKRKYTKAENLLKDVLDDELLKQKVKDIKKVNT